jgi:hypothetical protein
MNVEIIGIQNRGNPGTEHLQLRVLGFTDLQYFIVFDTTYLGPSAISNKQRHAFWFSPQQVQPGDNILLITGPGVDTKFPNGLGGTTYVYHWGLLRTVWNNTGDCAVLFEVNTWQTSKFE